MNRRFHLRNPSPLQRDDVDRALADVRDVLPWAEVREVGSTAVHGVLGKQDIDLLARVPEDRFQEAFEALAERFEHNPKQLHTEEYAGFIISRIPDVALQLTVKGGPHDDFEPFLQLLRTDPALRRAYNELKRAWDGKPMEAYRQAKAAFIERALQQAEGDDPGS